MKAIPLTQGKQAIVDNDDYERVMSFKWQAQKSRDTNFYAQRSVKKGDVWTSISMHKFILLPPVGMYVDHINGDGLDNRKSNLRACSISENNRNKEKRKTNTSGYKGVYFKKNTRKWIAKICSNRVYYHIGSFETPEDAYLAYCEKARQLHGSFANIHPIGDAK